MVPVNIADHCAEWDGMRGAQCCNEELYPEPYLYDHLDGGQGGCQVRGVGGSHGDRDAASIQAAVEGGDQVDP